MFALVIPCYNESKRFDKDYFIKFYKQLNRKDITIFLVNDGSKDTTKDLLDSIVLELQSDQLKQIHFEQNRGKAETIRQAITQINKDFPQFTWFGFLDADFATPIEEIIVIYDAVIKTEYKLAMGSRWLRLGSNIKRNPLRHYFGRVFATITSMLLKLEVYDTQCGAKVIHKELIPMVMQESFISRWIFDVEIIARMIMQKGHSYALHSIIEYPLHTWIEMGDSKIKMKDLLKLPFEIMRIKFKYKL